jgi:galactokinase
LDPLVYRRASHVVAENLRVGDFVRALEAGDVVRAGRLMDASHASLRDLFEVSSPELDLITDLARGHRGCLGARMTGAGFGGCGVALVYSDAVEGFPEAVASAYGDRVHQVGDAFVVHPSGPVAVVEAPI